MILIILLVILIVACFVPYVSVFLYHPFLFFKNVFFDLKKYIKYRKWRECKEYGRIRMYTGLFGKGKTLSAVHYVRNIYNKYNGKNVYVDGKWQIQYIGIISNVKLFDVPYVPLTSTEDIVNCHNGFNAATVCIVLIDEASTQFNSRNFKTNISSTLLNSMLTCRHHKFGMVLTAQRYMHVDALIRQITSDVYECDKLWRGMVQRRCSAWDLENATDIKLVKYKYCSFFITDSDYNAYDTSAIVDDIKRKQKNGELLTDSEVLSQQGNTDGNLYAIPHKSHRAKKYSTS